MDLFLISVVIQVTSLLHSLHHRFCAPVPASFFDGSEEERRAYQLRDPARGLLCTESATMVSSYVTFFIYEFSMLRFHLASKLSLYLLFPYGVVDDMAND